MLWQLCSVTFCDQPRASGIAVHDADEIRLGDSPILLDVVLPEVADPDDAHSDALLLQALTISTFALQKLGSPSRSVVDSEVAKGIERQFSID